MNFLEFLSHPPDLSHTRNFYSFGYIDPGSGYVFSSVLPMVAGIILTFLTSVFIFFRLRLFPLIKKYFVYYIVILIALSGVTLYYIRTMKHTGDKERVIVLGIDGLDSTILEKGWKNNLFPNLRILKETGSYSLLQTSVPPQSPIAWASFMTGVWPAKHGVYDFIARDPKTYALDLTFSDPNKNPLQVAPFWQYLEKQNIPTTILFLPDTFPPFPGKAKIFAGMGVPDVIGTMGAFMLITSSKTYSLDPKWRGRLVVVDDTATIHTEIEGPKYSQLQERKTSTVPLTIVKNNGDRSIAINISGQTITIAEGAFSDWVTVDFKIDFFTSIKGMVKFYLKTFDQDFTLYVTPINITPDKSVFPISTPKEYASELQKNYGQFYTQGLPHDTWALEEDIFDEDTFLEQADDILDQRKRIILGELDKSRTGLFIGYFGILDTIQHMYWRFLNDDSSPYQSTIETYYTKIDVIVGEVMRNLKEFDTLILLSDHGFADFQYEFNVNSWLRENGYLTLTKEDIIGKEYLENVDWSNTKAYAVGYNSIYFNLKGREKFGSVEHNEIVELQNTLIKQLSEFDNPLTNENIVKHIYTRDETGINKDNLDAPDLFIGYYKGIRSSWDTVVGGAPEMIVQKRNSKWSGDHLFDPTEVPGVLFLNKKIALTDPSIIDIAPSILKIFSAPAPSLFDGHVLE